VQAVGRILRSHKHGHGRRCVERRNQEVRDRAGRRLSAKKSVVDTYGTSELGASLGVHCGMEHIDGAHFGEDPCGMERQKAYASAHWQALRGNMDAYFT